MLEWTDIVLRIGLALLAGSIVGWNRGRAEKPAGLRTHALTSVGSAIFVMAAMDGASTADAKSRAIQGIATGVGFLGAGEIVHRTMKTSGNPSPRHLTSAAAIWAAAALGISAGVGLWKLTIVGIVTVLLILSAFKGIERRLSAK